MQVAAAVDERDRRRAIWIWPSLYVLGFWVPLFIRVSPASPPGSLSRLHAVEALKLFFGYWSATIVAIALSVAVGDPAPAVFVIGGATVVFVSLTLVGLARAIRATVSTTVGSPLLPTSAASR